MKQTVKTSRAAGYLEKMFRTLNADLFNGELEEPIITIQSTPTAYGHVTVGKTWRRRDDWRHELNIGAETLARPIEHTVATLIHEMVHLYNIKHDIQDCSRGGTYHNKRFRDEAEKHMLKIDKDERYGWTITNPTEELLDYIIMQGWTEIEMNRGYSLPGIGGISGGKGGSTTGKTTPGTTPKKSGSRKYVCPCCGTIVRATKTVNVICGECLLRMEEQ